MNSKILIAAIACVSTLAPAQSSSTAKKNVKAPQGTPVSAPRDGSSGQASGRAAQKNGAQRDRTSDQPSVSEGVAPDTNGGNMAGNHKDGWNNVTTTKQNSTGGNDGSTSQWPNRVAAGDVNGDGRADVTATAPKAGTQGANGNQNQPSRELGSGEPSGKRQHQPLTVQKQTDVSSSKQ